MTKRPTQDFYEVSALTIGTVVEVPKMGIGRIAEIGTTTLEGLGEIEVVRIIFLHDPSLHLQRRPYLVNIRNGRIPVHAFKILESKADNSSWEKIFAALQAEKGLGKKKTGSANARLYDTALQSGDAEKIAKITLTLKPTILGTGEVAVYMSFALAAMKVLAQRLAYAAERPETECRTHLMNVLAGIEKNPMEIFNPKYTPAEYVFPAENGGRSSTRGGGDKPPRADTKIDGELHLDLPIEKALHDTAFRVLTQPNYEVFCRRYLAKNFLASDNYEQPATQTTLPKKEVMAAMGDQAGEAEILLTLRHRSFALLMKERNYNVDGDALLAELHRIAMNKKITGRSHLARCADMAASNVAAAAPRKGPKGPRPQ